MLLDLLGSVLLLVVCLGSSDLLGSIEVGGPPGLRDLLVSLASVPLVLGALILREEKDVEAPFSYQV